MNKKKLTSMLVSLGLVGALGVGATLAYLSDSTQALENKFTFVEKGIEIVLDEAEWKNGEVTGKRTTEGNTYNNLIPNQLLPKDPTVTVIANSVNCNVFVSVKNENDAEVLDIVEINEAWQKIDPAMYKMTAEADTEYYVYVGTDATGEKEDGDVFGVVAHKANGNTVLTSVFDQVQVGDVSDIETNPTDIVIKAAAVQADLVSDYEAAAAALEMLQSAAN